MKLPFSLSEDFVVNLGTATTYAFVGNALIPYTSNYASNLPVTGDEWAAGTTDYAAFYDKYRVDGSSIKINLQNRSTGGFVDCVLLAAPNTAGGNPDTLIAELDALSYQDLMSWQYATWKSILANGNNQSVWFQKFRRTRNMLQYKDSRDQIELLTEMPTTLGQIGQKWPQSSTENNQWIYYLRIFNTGGVNASLKLTVKMLQYTTLQGLRVRLQTEVPA